METRLEREDTGQNVEPLYRCSMANAPVSGREQAQEGRAGDAVSRSGPTGGTHSCQGKNKP